MSAACRASGADEGALNPTMTALRFFFRATLGATRHHRVHGIRVPIPAGLIRRRRASCRSSGNSVLQALSRFSAFDDPGCGAFPGVIFLTGRAVHTHFNVWERIEDHGHVSECGDDHMHALNGLWAPRPTVSVQPRQLPRPQRRTSRLSRAVD